MMRTWIFSNEGRRLDVEQSCNRKQYVKRVCLIYVDTGWIMITKVFSIEVNIENVKQCKYIYKTNIYLLHLSRE